MDKESAFREILGKLRDSNVRSAVNDLAAQAGSGLGQAAVKTMEKDIGRMSAEAGQTIGRISGQRAAQEFSQAIPELVSQARGGAMGALKSEGARLARSASLMAGAGAITGAAVSKDRKGGAARGMGGGLLGGITGAAWGRRFGINPHAARMIGAAAGGALAGFLGDKERPVHKYAGVIIDHYDDRGETLRAIFPDPAQLPDVIKTAAFRPKEELPNEAFALIAIDGGDVLRKFACHDAGSTATSVIYFMEHAGKLPEAAVKTAASNLMEACAKHGMLPPEDLSKLAGEKTASVNITGQDPLAVIVNHRPSSDDDYAVVMPDGQQAYPIDNWENMKLASDYWVEHHKSMDPGVRRQFATKLAAKADQSGYPVRNEIREAGSTTWAEEGWVKCAAEMRIVALDSPQAAKDIHTLLEIRGSIGPEKYAQHLREFDVANGLDRQWDGQLPDPYASTFGIQKVSGLVWEDGADSVTDHQLHALATNHAGALPNIFSQDMIQAFEKDPAGIFKSMPTPQKRILARLAVDMVSQGGSEGQVPLTSDKSTDHKMKQGSLRGFEQAMAKASPAARKTAMGAIEKSAGAKKILARLGT